MFDSIDLALLSEGMAAAGFALTDPREAVSDGLSVVCQHRLDLAGRLLLPPFHKRLRILRGLVAPGLQIDPACGTVGGEVQATFRPLGVQSKAGT